MNNTLLRSWWLLALRGVIAMLCGVAAIALPAVTLVTLAALFAAFAVLAGTVWMFGAVRHRRGDRRWWVLLLLGVVSIAAGVIAALYPFVTTVALIIVMGANAIVTGMLDIVVAIRLRQQIKGESLLVLTGAVSVLFGLLVLLIPLGAGALALAWMIGIYALLTGALMVALSIQLRTWTRINAGRSIPQAGAQCATNPGAAGENAGGLR